MISSPMKDVKMKAQDRSDKGKDSGITRPLVLLGITVLIDLLGFGIILPSLPRYIEIAVGPNHSNAATIGGFLAASYSFTQFLCAPFWGRISDQYGRRPVILLSLIGVGLSYMLFGFAGNHLWMLFAARLTAGFLSSASIGVAFAYVADVTTPENRAKGIGILGACFGLGFLLGPTLGGLLGGYSPALPAFVAAGLAIGNFILSYFLLPESLPEAERAKLVGKPGLSPQLLMQVVNGKAGFLFLITFLVTFGFTAIEQIFGFYLLAVKELGVSPEAQPRTMGLILGFVGVLSVIVQGGLIAPLVRRFGEGAIARAGIIALGIGFAVFVIPRNIWVFAFVPSFFLAVGRALVTPALSTLVSRKAQLGQGLTLSVSQSFDALARTVGPISAGFLFRLSPQTPFTAASLVMVVALAVAFAKRGEMNSPVAPSVEAMATASEVAA